LGYTNPLDGGITESVTNLWDLSGTNLTVGSTTADNRLIITNGGAVYNDTGYIGYSPGADSNSVLVTGNGSVWQNYDGLYLGGYYSGTNWVNGGTGNSLTVDDGGRVLVGNVGYGNLPNLYGGGAIAVGDTNGAEMVVANGSTVNSAYTFLGLGSNDTGSVLITGSNTTWNGRFAIGYRGGDNTLTIDDGATVTNSDMGFGGIGGNSVLVTGEGTQLDMWDTGFGGRLNLGSSSNTFVLADGAYMDSFGSRIGSTSGSSHNRVVVTGAGTVWDNLTGGHWTSDVWHGYIELRGSENSLMVLDGGAVHTIRLSMGDYTSSNNTVVVSGAGSLLDVWSGLHIGGYGSNYELIVSDGGRMELDRALTIGSGSDGNHVSVSGINSVIAHTRNLRVGGSGSNNTLIIEDGGRVETLDEISGSWIREAVSYIGDHHGAYSNKVVVTGPGSVWTNSGDLYVGYQGSHNSMSILDGGAVYSDTGYIGYSPGADSNSVVIGGAGSVWHNREGLYLGGHYEGTNWIDGGAGNSLEVGSRGLVLVGEVDAGSLPGRTTLVVGDAGNDAALEVGNGSSIAIYSSGDRYIGLGANESGTVRIMGSNSTYTAYRDDMYVGYLGSGNLLAVTDGGYMSEKRISVGAQEGADNNRVEVSGERSVLGSDFIGIGWFGSSSNSLEISDGGVASNSTLWVTESDGDSRNRVLVSDEGSILSADKISLARWAPLSGSRSYALVITNGGYAESFFNVINGSSALVSGAGSVWYSPENGGTTEMVFPPSLILQSAGSITIKEGGVVSTREIEIGSDRYNHPSVSPSISNQVVVSGQGSLLELRSADVNSYFPPFVMKGYGNSMLIEDGGQVSVLNGNSYINGEENDIAVTGSGSAWTNSGDLYVGYQGSHYSMSILDGGAVYNDTGYIGYSAGADSNSVVIGGTGSVWHNREGLYLGGHYEGTNWINGGTGNSLTVEDGGLVLVGNVTNPARIDADGGIAVGDPSGNAEMVVANQSYVEAPNAYIGFGADESGSVLLTGSNTVWDVNHTRVGYEGSDNVLSITDGAKAIGTISIGIGDIVGYSGGVHYYYQRGSNNVLSVTDGGQVVGTINIDGLDGALIVTNGGSVVGGGVYISGDGNTVIVAGEDSVMSNGTLQVGGTLFGSDNSLSILDGATVYSFMGGLSTPFASDVIPTSTNNTVRVSGDGSTWKIGKDGNTHFLNGWLDIGNGALLIEDGGTVLAEYSTITYGVDYHDGVYHNVAEVSVDGTGSVWSTATMLYMRGGAVTISDGGRVDTGSLETGYSASLTVTDEGSSLNVADELLLGYARPGSVLEILNGGAVYSGEGYIGAKYLGSPKTNNSVLVTGNGSIWQNHEGLYIGGRYEGTNWIKGGTGNSLTVADGGLVSTGGDPGGLVTVGGDYYQDASSLLRFGVDTNAAGAPVNALMTVDGTAEFEEGTRILYASNVGQLHFDRFYTNKLVEADELIVAGVQNPDYHDLEQLDASGSLVDVIFWVDDQDIYALAGRKWLAESAGFADGTMMHRLADEIDDRSLQGDPGANRMINLLNVLSGAQQNAQLTQQYERGTPNHLHIQGMTEGLGELAKHASRRPADTPEGAAGPHRPDQGPRGWVRSYGSWGDRSADGAFSAYDHTMYGTLVGIDWLQRSDILFGVAGGYVRSDIDQDDGSRSEATTGYGVVYVSLGTEDWFGDISGAFGRSSIENRSGTVFGNRSDYNAGNFALYLGGGREIRFGGDRFTLTPEGSLLLTSYQQGDYVETGLLPRAVEAYDRQSAISGLGARLAMQEEYETLLLKPELRARWLHEFNADTESVNYTLVNGSGDYRFIMPAAEENILELGAGLTGRIDDAWSLVLDVDWRIGEDYDAYAVGGRVMYEF
jgi:T5SS/PEP-CTERM-associated repeat protein